MLRAFAVKLRTSQYLVTMEKQHSDSHKLRQHDTLKTSFIHFRLYTVFQEKHPLKLLATS